MDLSMPAWITRIPAARPHCSLLLASGVASAALPCTSPPLPFSCLCSVVMFLIPPSFSSPLSQPISERAHQCSVVGCARPCPIFLVSTAASLLLVTTRSGILFPFFFLGCTSGRRAQVHYTCFHSSLFTNALPFEFAAMSQR